MMWNEYQNICLFRLWRASEYTAAGNETAILMAQSNDFFCFRTKNHLFFCDLAVYFNVQTSFLPL